MMMKVSSKSSPRKVAAAITEEIKRSGGCEVQSVGAGATNQAVKSIAIARGFVASLGMDLLCVPGFAEAEVKDDRKITALRFTIASNKIKAVS